MPISTTNKYLHPYYSFASPDRETFIEEVAAVLRVASWRGYPQGTGAWPAYIDGTFGTIVNGNAVNIDGEVYTFKTTFSGGGRQVSLTGDPKENLKSAINGDPEGEGVAYYGAPNPDPLVSATINPDGKMRLSARVGGPAANRKAVSGTATWLNPEAVPATANKLFMGGYKLVSTTPQKLKMGIYLTDSANTGAVIQPFSVLSGQRGQRHPMNIPPLGGPYQIIAGPTNFFISTVGVSAQSGLNTRATACCAGSLYIPQESLIPLPKEAWFSFSDFLDSPFFTGANPRVNLDWDYGVNVTNFNICYGGVVVADQENSSSSTGRGLPRINYYAGTTPNSGVTTQWQLGLTQPPPPPISGSPPYPRQVWYEPILAFNINGSLREKPIGYIYDALIKSIPDPLDTQMGDVGYWGPLDTSMFLRCYTDNYYKGVLYNLGFPVDFTPSPSNFINSQYKKALFSRGTEL